MTRFSTGGFSTRLFGRRAPVVPVVRLTGTLLARGGLRQSLSMESVAPLLERAFGQRGARAVALVINSPGGAPVQASQIHARVRQLADEKKLPVLVFVEDVAASGGYWLACAGDEIFVDETSIVGSIGVVAASFGFQDFIARHGVERRLHTAGSRKGQLDPFLPQNPDDVRRLHQVLDEMHARFQRLVVDRRRGRLKASEDELFSGEFWTGTRAVDLGLADGVGELRATLRHRFGDRVRLKPITAGRKFRLAVPGFARGQGAPEPLSLAALAADGLIESAEARALWARFGL
ncbi:MAG: S49 family peptidase [Alphaproteobacteria bacterium]